MKNQSIYDRAARFAKLDCTCVGINQNRWDSLMKGARPANRKRALKVAFLAGVIDKLQYQQELKNEFFNPYDHFVTRTHVVYVHSRIEHFIRVAA